MSVLAFLLAFATIVSVIIMVVTFAFAVSDIDVEQHTPHNGG